LHFLSFSFPDLRSSKMRISKRKGLTENEDSKASWKRVHIAEQQQALGLEGFISLETLDDAQVIRGDDSVKDESVGKNVM
jgi:hypothetical protein